MPTRKGAVCFVPCIVLVCAVSFQRAAGQGETGPQTTTVALNTYQQVRYVSRTAGSDTGGDGSRAKPWATVTYALSQIIDAGPSNVYALLVAEGTYGGSTIEMKEHVALYGGFDAANWKRDIFANRTILDGEGSRRVVVAADNSVLDGFVIQRGRVGGGKGLDIVYGYDATGSGAGIAINKVSPTISNNVFTDNMTTRPVPWDPKPINNDDDDGWHQTANDGGAISVFDHASPVISNNIFYNNRTETGRGGAVSSNYYSSPKIIDNVFMNNTASTNDSERSGDGGAINAYERGSAIIENNIIANNEAASANDGGGVAVHWWVSALLKDNIIVNNKGGDDGGGVFIAGQKHYIEDQEPRPPAGFFVELDGNRIIGNSADTGGCMRTTKEVVTRFTNNVIAENGEIYFQNTTAELINNTFLDQWEDKERVDVFSQNNIFGGSSMGSGPTNFEGNARFADDGFSIRGSVDFDQARYVTTVVVSGANYQPDSLVGRIAVAGGKWTVVKSNTAGSITVWGDMGGNLTIKQSYHLAADSPCINTGTDIADDFGELVLIDMDGELRPDPTHVKVDIGADEFDSKPAEPLVSTDLIRDGVINWLDYAALIEAEYSQSGFIVNR